MSVTPEAHLSWILGGLQPVAAREYETGEALGFVLAEDAVAAHHLPLWASSAMDGYAVRAADTVGASSVAPVTLRVIGEIAAGSSWDPPLVVGEAVRIMTGAPVPTAADAVVRVELTIGEDAGSAGARWAEESVRVLEEVPVGADIRERGEDLAAGTPVAFAGERLTAARASALWAAGIARVRARPAPRVAVLVTGAELQVHAGPLVRGMIPESNSLLMRGLLSECGIHEPRVEHCPDDAATLRERLTVLAGEVDAILTTGGIGPGAHDVVGAVLDSEPYVRTARLAMRPAKHQRAGRLAGGAFVFALPGNPVSAAVSFELFVRPALLAMQGLTHVQRPKLRARAAVGWRGAVGCLQVLPISFDRGEDRGDDWSEGRGDDLGDDRASPDGLEVAEFGAARELVCAPAVHARRVSHSVGGFGAAEGYALVGPERGNVAAGDLVTVIRVVP